MTKTGKIRYKVGLKDRLSLQFSVLPAGLNIKVCFIKIKIAHFVSYIQSMTLLKVN